MGTILARTGLTKPARGDLNWDDEIQGWLDKLDTYGAFADETLTWTAAQTFTGLTTTTGTFKAEGLISLAADSPQSVLLTEATTLITPTSSVIKISSDNATPANRIFTIADATQSFEPAYALLILRWSGTDSSCGQLAAGTTMKITADWPHPTTPENDTLVLLWTGALWLELSRSENPS